MSKKIFLSIVSIATALSMHAQTSDTSQAALLDEVIVTANKFPQKQSSTGKVVTVITKEQIEKSTGRTVAQLLNEQAGITINGALNNLGSNQTLYMRGASSGRTLILVDGVPVNDPSYINNDFDLNLLSMNSIERIEIARGAQSTLYGSDAIAGVINIITISKDVTKPVHVKATVAAGNYGTYRGNLQVYGKADRFTYNARYGKLKSNGFSSAYDSTGKGNFDNDGYDGDVASASVQYQLSGELSVRSFAQYSRYKTDVDEGLFNDEKDYTSGSKILLTGAGFQYKKSGWSLNGQYQYSENSRSYDNDSTDFGPFDFIKYSTDHYEGRSQYVELYSNVDVSKNFTLLHGADHRFNSMNSRFSFVSPYGNFPATLVPYTSHSQSSLFASLFFHDNQQKLNIEAGGRLNVHSEYGSNHTYTVNPSYNINQHYRVFASIATGFKAPTLYQLYSSYGATDLKPERSKTHEFGIQQQHAKVSSRVVYFYRQVKDGIDFDNRAFRYFNYIQQTVNGLELEATVKPVTAVTISANYNHYFEPEEYSQSRSTFKDTIYNYLLRRPQDNLNVTASVQLTKSLLVSASGKYVGKHYDAGGYQEKDVLLDSYFLLGAYAEYKYKQHFKVFADAQNVTNKKFFDVRGYNSIPFLINGGITFTW
jgi:vitamin B12 transporter